MRNTRLEVHIRAEILDPRGKIIKRLPWKRARSYVQQLIDLLYRGFNNTATLVRATNNTEYNVSPAVNALQLNAGAGVTTYGIQVGTGEGAVEIADYKLGAQVTTNIAYSSVTVSAPVTDGTTRLLEVVRTFTNNTGATLNVKEVGLVCWDGVASHFFLIDRSLYNVTINNGASASLRYRIKVTV